MTKGLMKYYMCLILRARGVLTVLAAVLLGLATPLGAEAQDQLQRKNVLSLNMANGLPSNFVDDVFADSDGFVWIATYGGGLVRYDGYGVMDFGVGRHSWGLKSNSCCNLCEDKFHRLWVSFDEFTEVLDLGLLQSVVPEDRTKQLEPLLKERSVHVSCDALGRIWMVTMTKVCCVLMDDEGSVRQVLTMPYRSNTPDVFLGDLDGNGTMWTAFGGRLCRLSVAGNRLVESSISPLLDALPVAYITEVVKYDDRYWIGTNGGLYCYDAPHNRVSDFHSAEGSLSHDYVSSLAVSDDHRLVVGTLRGLDVLNASQDGFYHVNLSDYAGSVSQSGEFVNCVRSLFGQLWVGTEGGGLMRFVPRQLQVQNWTQNAVNAIHEDATGTLWVGLVEGGLGCKRPGDETFSHYTTSTTRLSHNSVSALASDGKGRLWVGTWGRGLNVMPLGSPEQLAPLEVQPAYAPLLNFIGALEYDARNDGLWIGSNDGIFFYDLKTGTVSDAFDGCRNFRGCIGSLLLPDGTLWMGCLEGAVTIDLKRKPFKYHHLRNKLDAPESGIIDKIDCFCMTKDGTLWLGSNGYGLYKRIVGKDGRTTFKAYRVEDGLVNNAVKGIVEGQNGMLWIATVHGLSHFNPKTGVFTNYHEQDGLLSSQFYWNAAERAADGTLYFGSDKGLTALFGESSGGIYRGRLHFTQLTVNNVVAEAGGPYISQNVAQARRITLRESDKSFTIEFSALHYGNETEGIYSYRMRGFEKDWTPLPSGAHSVRYTSLPPGSYVFEVKYASALDDDESGYAAVDVRVAPYFWKSWWFRLLMLLALLGGVAWWLRRMQQRRQRQLEQAKKEEAERLMRPIEKVLRESEDPYELQQRIQTILDSQQRYRESSRKSVEADAEEAGRSTRPFMEQVMEIMEKNYMNSEFDVTDFCQQIGMSRSLLAKKLNEHTGQSTTQFIRNYRLDVAKQILLRGDQRNVAEVAFSVGFNDPKYFTRCFTKQYGTSPSKIHP